MELRFTEMERTLQTINEALSDRLINSIALRVGKGDEILFDLFKSNGKNIDETTLFDMASVTKIVATTTLCYIAFEKKLLSPDDEISAFFECSNDKKGLRISHLLTHTIGFGHKNLTLYGRSYDDIAEYITHIECDIPYGSDVLYSCPGFILLGKILEKIFGERLDVLFQKYVAKPLSMASSCFCPKETVNIVNSDKEAQYINVVNDYNCRYLGGIAGNAGLFSNISDLTKYINMLQRKGSPLFGKEVFELGTVNYTEGMSSSRAYGFVYADGKYKRLGKLFTNGEIGHGGHTGQSVFLNKETGLYVILLTDATLSCGYEKGLYVISGIHNAIYNDLSLK